MSAKAQYRVVPAESGGFFAMRLHPVATFTEEGLANDFANLKNGGAPDGIYTVSPSGNEFFVLRDEQIALFYDEGFAREYVEMKEYRATVISNPVHASAPAQQDNDQIWAEAAAMVSAGK